MLYKKKCVQTIEPSAQPSISLSSKWFLLWHVTWPRKSKNSSVDLMVEICENDTSVYMLTSVCQPLQNWY